MLVKGMVYNFKYGRFICFWQIYVKEVDVAVGCILGKIFISVAFKYPYRIKAVRVPYICRVVTVFVQ